MKKKFIEIVLVTAVLGWLLPSGLYAQPFAYITNSGDDTVSVIDTATNTVITIIPVGRSPYGVAVHPNGLTVYVTNSSDGTVSVIDTATNKVVDTILVGDGPVYAVAMAPDGSFLYATGGYSDSISVIDTTTNTVADTIVDIGALPASIAVHPNGLTLYVGSIEGPTSVIDTVSRTEVATIEPSVSLSFTVDIAVHPDGSRVYEANIGSHTVNVIDTVTNTVIDTIVVGSVEDDAHGLAVSPDGSSVYVTGVDSVFVIDTATDTVTKTIPIEDRGYGIGVHPDGTVVYVAHDPNTVSVIDTATGTVTSEIAVGSAPAAYGLFITPSIVTIDDIIEFFDESVADNSLSRVNWGSLVIFKRSLVLAQRLIEQERFYLADRILINAYFRCDGEPEVADLVQGPAVSELNCMILDLID